MTGLTAVNMKALEGRSCFISRDSSVTAFRHKYWESYCTQKNRFQKIKSSGKKSTNLGRKSTNLGIQHFLITTLLKQQDSLQGWNSIKQLQVLDFINSNCFKLWHKTRQRQHTLGCSHTVTWTWPTWSWWTDATNYLDKWLTVQMLAQWKMYYPLWVKQIQLFCEWRKFNCWICLPTWAPASSKLASVVTIHRCLTRSMPAEEHKKHITQWRIDWIALLWYLGMLVSVICRALQRLLDLATFCSD